MMNSLIIFEPVSGLRYDAIISNSTPGQIEIIHQSISGNAVATKRNVAAYFADPDLGPGLGYTSKPGMGLIISSVTWMVMGSRVLHFCIVGLCNAFKEWERRIREDRAGVYIEVLFCTVPSYGYGRYAPG